MIEKFLDANPYNAAIDVIELPKVLSFSEYDSMSGNVAIADLLRRQANDPKSIKPSEKVFFAFWGLVGTTLEEINKIDKFEPLKARLEAASNKITRELFKYWT